MTTRLPFDYKTSAQLVDEHPTLNTAPDRTANARPPHLVFVARLGSSGEMFCFLQFFCCVIAACLSLALLVLLGFVTECLRAGIATFFAFVVVDLPYGIVL